MKFIDEAKIYIEAGRGGDGACSFRREKYIPKGGPDGGDGGDGGSVIIEASHTKRTLLDFKYQQHFRAEAAGHGSGQNKTGKNGADITLHVPLGTELYNFTTKEFIADLSEEGQKIIIAHGGQGGRGNTRFKSSTNQAPRRFDYGKEGESITLQLELKVLADVGILGFPNVGKSTFLSVVSNAKPKVADYPFTTLHPQLGLVRVDEDFDFVLADLPGLIENAAEGVGLGFRFLKHLERTKMLLHFLDISAGRSHEVIINDYHILNRELEKYGGILPQKKQLVVLTKYDVHEEDQKVSRLFDYFNKMNKTIISISSVTKHGIKDLLYRIKKELSLLEETKEL